MAKSQMVIQVTVICGCGSLDALATYYGGGANEDPGGVVPFMAAMIRCGWRELTDDQWICPGCVEKHPRFRKGPNQGAIDALKAFQDLPDNEEAFSEVRKGLAMR